ncbi:MAG: agmatinase [Pseudomonadales bacterium]
MNQEKLERLRATYADADGADYMTERFQRMNRKLADNPRSSSKPYSGISTLLDLPHREDWTDLDVALVGVPMDLGVTNRSGARYGPRAVRTVERIGPYHYALDEVPAAVLRAADIGDVPFRSRFSLHDSIEDIQHFYEQLVAAGVKPISVGGDHSITLPIMRALGAQQPLAMVHIDAHHDTGGPYDGEKFYHGGPFRNAVLEGVLDPDHCFQVGIRGPAEASGEFAYEAGMRVMHIEDVETLGIQTVIAEARRVVGNKPCYITLDVDGIDPAYTPGTGTPEIGGLTPLQVQLLIRGLKGLNIIGGDVVEVAPEYDPGTSTATVAAQMLFEIFSVMAVSQ